MVHVEKFKVKGNLYYKLVHNIRKEGKITSKSKYLGKVLPAGKELEKLKKEFYEQILKERAEERGGVTPVTKQRTEEHESLLESLPEVVFRSNPESLYITYTNKASSSTLGYSPAEFSKDPHLLGKIIHPLDKKKVLAAFSQARKAKTPIDLTYRIIKKNKNIIWVLNSITWEHDKQGRLTGMVGLIADITEKKESEDKFQQLFDYSPVAMLEHDLSAVKQYLNTYKLKTEEEIQKRFDKNPQEIKEVQAMVKVADLNPATIKLFKAKDQESFLKIYHSKQFCRDSNEVFIKELAAIAQNKDDFENELNIFSMDGRRIQIVLKWSVPHAYKGTYGKVLVTLVDTSLQRQLAETMHIKNYAIESSSNALLITDLEGKINYANQAFFELWNIKDFTSVMGKKVEKYLPHKEGPMKIIQQLHMKKEWRGTLMIGKVKPHYLDTHAAFVSDEFKEPLGMVFSFVDITELKRSEQIRLEFTNIAAHELKTPITPLKTLLTMIYEDPQQYGVNEEGMKHLTVCLRNVDRLNVLIGDILDISRLEAGGMKFVMAKFDLLEVVKRVLGDYAETAKGKGLQLKSKLPKTLPQLYGDQQRISQIIGNLLKNAINFTDQGSIMVKAVLKKEAVQVDIVDTGAGIKKIAQAKLFTKFYQEQDITTRKTKGSGLGLAIAKEIIKYHGGKIWVFSEGKGKGSTFSFTLPLKPHLHKEHEKKAEKKMLIEEKVMLDEGKSKQVKKKVGTGDKIMLVGEAKNSKIKIKTKKPKNIKTQAVSNEKLQSKTEEEAYKEKELREKGEKMLKTVKKKIMIKKKKVKPIGK